MNRSVSRLGVFAAVAGVMLLSGVAAFGQGADPFVGTWVLNVEKSEFQGSGVQVRSRTMTISPKGDMYTFSQDTYRVGQDAVAKVVYDARNDGKDYRVTGGAFSLVSITRLGDVLTRKGKERGMDLETAIFTLSSDGKTMTVVTTGSNNGVMYGSTQIFEKK